MSISLSTIANVTIISTLSFGASQYREPAREHQSIWMLSEEEAAIMIFVPIRRIRVVTCVTPTDRGGPLTRTISPGSKKSALSPFPPPSLSLSFPSLSSFLLFFLPPILFPHPVAYDSSLLLRLLQKLFECTTYNLYDFLFVS